jgi:hypothetical protein
MVVSAGCQVPQVKVTWSELPDSLATWEDLTTLKQTFPDAPVWGQGEGNVSIAMPTTEEHVLQGPRKSTRPRSLTKQA